MAATDAGRRLTESHRRAQLRVAARTVRQLGVVWPLLDPVDLDGTRERWVRAALPVIEQNREVSAGLAGRYMSRFREVEVGPPAGWVPSSPAVLVPERAATSLLVTGPHDVKRQMVQGFLLDRAVDLAGRRSAAAGMRHVLDGGRSVIERSVAADPVCLGWARVTEADPCAFCAMLASRGPVYKESTGLFVGGDPRGRVRGSRRVAERYHDDCKCSLEPVYSTDAAWPGESERFRDLWDEATAGLGGAEARTAFRRAYEGRA